MLLGASSSLLHQFARYLFVGGVAFVIDFGSLYLLTEFAGFHYLVSAAVAFLLGVVANYQLSRVWVFDRRTVENVAVEFAVFTMIGVVGLGLNEGIIWFVREKAHFHYMAAKAISAGMVLIWNFGARKAVLFPSRPLAPGLTKRMSLAVGALWSAGVLAAYFLYCLAIQASTGAWQANFVAYPDEPSHFVGAVMVRDWLLSGRTAPLSFARDYYNHYPFFAVGYWPPMFYVVTAFEFLVVGVGRVQALLVPAAFASITAWLIYQLLRRRIGVAAAVCAGAIYLSLPVAQQWFCAVMVDHMTACLCIASAALLLRYLDQPSHLNGIFLAFLCAFATLSKYSAAYTVGLPWAAVLLLRRGALLRKPSFLIQPVIWALLVGPWAVWTKGLSYYGLPAERPAYTTARAALFLARTFEIFPPALTAVIILGLLALLALPEFWREDVGVLGLLCGGQLLFLFLSPVGAEQRYLLAPAASLLALSFAGWAAALSRMPYHGRHTRAVGASVAVLSAVFMVVYFGQYPRPKHYPIQLIVETVLKNDVRAEQRLVVPADLEGPFIAEFVARERHRPSYYLQRPSKLFAREDWFGGNFSLRFTTTEQIMDYFRQNPVKGVIWHDRADAGRLHMLGDMLRRNPSMWRKTGVFGPDGEMTSWAIYEQAPCQESH